jgi:hypothetical protein
MLLSCRTASLENVTLQTIYGLPRPHYALPYSTPNCARDGVGCQQRN